MTEEELEVQINKNFDTIEQLVEGGKVENVSN